MFELRDQDSQESQAWANMYQDSQMPCPPKVAPFFAIRIELLEVKHKTQEKKFQDLFVV